MKWGMILIVFSLTGCVAMMHGIEQVNIDTYPNEIIVNGSYNKVWSATIMAISDFPLTLADKDSGLISTDWKSISGEFIFIRDDGLAYKSAPGSSFQEKRERLNINLKEKNGKVEISFKSNAQVLFNNAVVAAGMGVRATAPHWRAVNPDTLAIKEISDEINSILSK